MIKRSAYQKLLLWKTTKSKKPLILRGVRQCGKTYLIKSFAEKEYPKFHYINFEFRPDAKEIFERDLDPETILPQIEQLLKTRIDREKELLIFDEIQECPKALTSLKYFNENLPELDIISAGSLIGVRLSESSFPVGKVSFLNLTPLSFEEFLLATKEEFIFQTYQNLSSNSIITTSLHEEFWKSYLHYQYLGGLPEVVNTFLSEVINKNNLFDRIREKQLELIVSYTSDIAKHAGKINALHVERVWRNIPNQLAKEMDDSAKKFRFKEVLNGKGFATFSGPIDWLVTSELCIQNFITESVQIPLDANIKENSFKLFAFDVGILGALSNLPLYSVLEQNYSTYKGYYAENFVIQSLKSLGGNSFFSWTSGKTAEVEFLYQYEDLIVPIEVKSGRNRRSKSLRVYEERFNPKLSILFSSQKEIVLSKNRLHLPIYLAPRLKDFIEQVL